MHPEVMLTKVYDKAQTHAIGQARDNGAWKDPIEVPNIAAFGTGGSAWVESVSCAPTGNCAADGYYNDDNKDSQPFVAGS